MSWGITDIIGIGLRLFSNRAEVERLARKSLELFNEWRVLIMNVAPQLLELTAIDTRLKDERGVAHQYDVEWVQLALNHLLHPAPPIAVDGKMGEQTRNAISLYQRQRDLTVDGWLGPLTMAQLEDDIRKAHAV